MDVFPNRALIITDQSIWIGDRGKRRVGICNGQYGVVSAHKLLLLRVVHLDVGCLLYPREAAHREVGDEEEGGQGAATSESGAVVALLFES